MLVGTVQDYMHDFTCTSMAYAFSHIRMVRGFNINFYGKDVYEYQKKINKILVPFVTPYLKPHLQTYLGISDVFVIDDYTLPNTDDKKISLLHFDDQLVLHPGPYVKYRLDHEQCDDDTHFSRCSTLFIVDTTIDKVIETESCVSGVVILSQHYNVDTCRISRVHMSVGAFGETNTFCSTFCSDILLQVLQHAYVQDLDTLKISLRV